MATREFAGSRWGPVVAGSINVGRDRGLVPLKQVARVHRGVATGANQFFVLHPSEAERLGIDRFTVPCISRANEVIRSGGVVGRSDVARVLLVIPPTMRIDEMPAPLRAYIAQGERLGTPDRYLCRHRTPWWSVGQPRRPPIIVTYMARRPPVFARNPDGLALINVARGIFPSESWCECELDTLVRYLNRQGAAFRGAGRTYQGGLEKFEPSEAEELLVPRREVLRLGGLDPARYITGPPISKDDLVTLVGASPFVASLEPAIATRTAEILFALADPLRFPWIRKGRRPASAERSMAIRWTAGLCCVQ